MSTITYLFVFSRTLQNITAELIDSSLMLLEPLSTEPWALVTRRDCSDDSWKTHLNDSELPESTAAVLYHGPKDVYPQCPLNEVAQHYISSDLLLSADVLGAKYRLQTRLYEDAHSFPADVRKNFDLANCVFKFGWHDIFIPGDELQPPEFVARPLVSMHLWGYGAPHLEAFLPLVTELDSFKEIQSKLSALWGDTEVAIIPVYA